MRLIIPGTNIGDCAAAYVVKKIKEFNHTKEKLFVLGLPTASTPEKMYKRLVELYR